jgi:uncharacterized protein
MLKLYRNVVLDHSVSVLLVLGMVLSFFAWHAGSFKLDASADSLLLENDQDLARFRQVSERYGSQDFLVITVTPNNDLFSDESIEGVRKLRDELRQISNVASVTTFLDVPLLNSSDVPLLRMLHNIPTLEKPEVDRVRAREEIRNSPVYRELLMSVDATTTAIQIDLKQNENFLLLRKQKTELLGKQQSELGLTADEVIKLLEVQAQYDVLSAGLDRQRHKDILTIRAIMQSHSGLGELHLGGVPMIADDMMTYIGSDLVVFGSGVALFLILMLTLIFREWRWVVLPLLSCFYAGLLMIGLLGWLDWRVTVISSNFISLMLIITMSMNIHLVVRYKQLCQDCSELSQRELVLLMVQKMVLPCFYTALTTIIAFSSLMFSEIRPVIDFGWMMTIGLTITFMTSFTLFPALLVKLKKSTPESVVSHEKPSRVTAILAAITRKYGLGVISLSVLLGALSVIGVRNLIVENSFINYFREHTEISQGMQLIDDKLGGTTPLDVILVLDDDEVAEEEDGFFSDLFDSVLEKEDTWFTVEKMRRIKEVHDYLDSLPEVGKVLSLASFVRMGEQMNDGKEFDDLVLTLIYKRIPDDLKAKLIEPYLSIEHDEVRISLRIFDSMPDLRRKELIEKIRYDLVHKLGFEEDKATLTGMLVLYNNMLQSLYQSQIQTLGVVMLGIGLMLLVLFRSLSLALVGLIPNILAAVMIPGFMGWAAIPLDMMTITIAAITIGIAVDNGIHYIYRFREEYARCGDYLQAMEVCHANIGRAVFYTSITIVFGFSILALSNFIPTILFGVLTAMAMCIALLAALTLLPKLILLWKPFPAK